MATSEQSASRVTRATSLSAMPSLASAGKARLDKILNLAEAAWDGLVAAAAVAAAVYLYQAFHLGKQAHFRPSMIALAATVVGALFVVLLDREGVYRSGNSLLRIRETERVLRVSMYAGLLAMPVLYFAGHAIPRWIIVLSLVFVAVFLTLAKQLFYHFVQLLRAKGVGTRNVVIYGAGYSGRRVFSALVRSPKLGLMPVAVVDDDLSLQGRDVFDLGYRRTSSVRVSRGPLTWELLQHHKADLLVIAIPSLSSERFAEVVNEALDAGIGVAYMARRSQQPSHALDFLDVDGLMLASYREVDSHTTYDPSKRVVDLIVASASLILFAPLFAVFSLLIRIDSPGPALFIQERVGGHGKLFRLFKFRTMYADAPRYANSPTEGSDPRITRVGRFLRRSSLDELPQLLNVIRGDMSLVGPRPEMPFVVDRYTPWVSQRLIVKPGITGLWQLSADRAFPIHDNVQYDLYYIRNRGFFIDIAILLHTLAFAMKGI